MKREPSFSPPGQTIQEYMRGNPRTLTMYTHMVVFLAEPVLPVWFGAGPLARHDATSYPFICLHKGESS